MSVGRHAGVPLAARKPVVIGLATLTFLLGIGVGSADSGDSEAELVVAELTSEVENLQGTLDLSRPAAEFDELTDRVDELEQELDGARSSEDELENRSAGLDDREAELAAWEDVLADREAELESRETDVASSEAAPPAETPTEPEPQGGCGAGQVDINTAGVEELQLIYEIGPERAQQIVSLRPFGSVDDLVRVSGIAKGRLGGIKAQGVACVD